MLISTKIIIDMETGEILARDSCDYSGPLELFCGASQQQKDAQAAEADLAKQQTDFYKLMSSDFSTIFGQNQDILKGLRTAFEPIVAAGPNQEGFSPEELTAMRTGAKETTAQGAQNAQIAANARSAAAGGSDLPNGARDVVSAMINTSAGNENSREQGDITTNDYATGRQNFFNATQGLNQSVAATEGASSQFAGATSGSGSVANQGAANSMEGATEIQQANSAWMGPVFGMIGSIGGAALGNFGGLSGKKKT